MASAVSSGFRPPGPSPSGGSAATSLTMPVNSGGIGGQPAGVNPAGSNPGVTLTSVASNSAMHSGGGSNIGTTNLSLAGVFSSNVTSNFKPVPMKLFATWEVDRTPPNCIPRLCSLTLTRLVLHKALGADLNSVIIAVKMQSSKRTLRSNEIELPSNGLLDTEIELTFSLQYPHFLKREGNLLHIMLQRRKKYKNRTILGFKTLAVGIINMSQVLQKQMDLELELFGDLKDKSGSSSVGKVYMLSLSSQPVDHEDAATGERQKSVSEEGADRVEIFSDDDDDFSSPEEGSDSEPMLDDQVSTRRLMSGRKARGLGSGKTTGSASHAARQRNLKQKFVSLLKKFKVTDPEELDQEQATLDQKISEGTVDPADIEDLFNQLEDYSDSQPDDNDDTISIGSTPKPSLKPFFCSSRNLLHEARSVVAAAAVAKAQTSDRDYLLTRDSSTVNHPANSDHGPGSDRISDDSSKEAVSDSHPDTLTDPEFSDPPIVTSSPPQSGDEIRRDKEKERLNSGNPASTGTTLTGSNLISLSGGVGCPGTSASNERTSNSAVGAGNNERKSRLFSKDKTSAFSLKQQKQGSSNANSSQGMSSFSGGATGGTSERSSLLMGSGSALLQGTRIQDSTGNRIASSSSTNQQATDMAHKPRTALLEQLSRILPSDSDTLPDQLILANTCDRQGAHLAAKLADYGHRVICTAGQADVRATLTCLVAKIQKFCNTKTQNPHLVKVALVGSDTFVNQVLRPYVELFSSKPPDWQGFIKFFIIPLGVNTVSKHIGTQDPMYASLFLHESWRELLEMAEPGKAEVSEIVNRVVQYLAPTSSPNESLINLPVAEAMVTYKEKSSDDESSQVFIPFVSDVKVGTEAMPGPSSLELDDTLIGSPNPPAEMKLTPPSSPHVGSGHNVFSTDGSLPQSGAKERPDLEPIDLQLDYWTADGLSSGSGGASGPGAPGSTSGGLTSSVSSMSTGGKGRNADHSSSRTDSKRDFGRGSDSQGGGKASIKTSIWFMQVMKLGVANTSAGEQPTFTMHYWLKEKKQKTVMRLGKKKDKDKEAEIRSVDGITRLICLSKSQAPLKVHIDGIEWMGVKFFQLSSQWQTHIKYFPVAGVSTIGIQTLL